MLRRRVPQLILVAVAGYELRGLLSALVAALRLLDGGSPGLLGAGALLALALGLLLLQVARGLSSVVTVPRWVLALLGLWCVVASALLVLISADGVLGGHGVDSLVLGRDGPWAEVPALLGLGIVLTFAPEGGRWLARHALKLQLATDAAVRGPAQPRPWVITRRSGPAPLLAGWSDRGPPSPLSSRAI